MAIVLAGVGAFVYLQLRHDLYAAVDIRRGVRPGARAGRQRDRDHPRRRPRAARGWAVLARFGRPTSVDRRPPGLDPARLLVVPARLERRRAFLVVGATLSNTDEALARVVDSLLVAFPVALGACSLVGWLLASAALQPVERMRREAAAITASDPGRRLPVPATDDTLTRLATTLNTTFDRLQTALERERRFVDDASHELPRRSQC